MIIKHNSMDYLLSITENLEKHNTVIVKCDTIYGIIGIPLFTFEKICSIKGRSAEKRFLILIPGAAKVDLFVDSGDLLPALPSTIINIREQPYKLVRQGQVVLPQELFA